MIDFHDLSVREVRCVRDHSLWLRFSDGVEGVVDLGDRLDGPVFQPLQDPDLFAEANLDDGDYKRLDDDWMAREAAECAATLT